MKQCVKCKNQNIDEGILEGYGGNSYKSNKFNIFRKAFTQIKPKMFVCLNCGYAEIYVDAEKLRNKI